MEHEELQGPCVSTRDVTGCGVVQQEEVSDH